MRSKSLKPLLLISFPVILLAGLKVALFPHFRVSTTAMEPALDVHEIVLGMNTSSFGIGDIVFYEANVPGYGKQLILHRVVAGPGDKLEIKGGMVYVNDSLGDKYWMMKYTYLIHTEDPQAVRRTLGKKADNDRMEAVGEHVYSVYLGPEDAVRLKRNSKVKNMERFTAPRDENNEYTYYSDQNDWSVDNFGPLTIQAGHYFVMGDNRHNSADSRFMGPVNAASIKGIILN